MLEEQEPHKDGNKEVRKEFCLHPSQWDTCSGPTSFTRHPARTRNTTRVLLLAGKWSTSEKINENTYRMHVVAIPGWL